MKLERFRKLIYSNALAKPVDVNDFVMEGKAAVSFPRNRMRLESLLPPESGQKANLVFWCPITFPHDVVIQWKFCPIYEPGLCIMFFGAKGVAGQDIFDEQLHKRTGEYQQYHHGDINAYHISYFRRPNPDETVLHTCNLRKSYGFHMVAQGADPIPTVSQCKDHYEITIAKDGAQIAFYIDNLKILEYEDDGKTYGPVIAGGKIGFRQMSPLIAEYWDLKVYTK